ncbi:hypothetical protein HQ865_10680 [Mucilaginibacter mali]|uniref:Uncharacterized protein n=1 Tax=Mucilaginibacter mali TaxID=2740462 RepID=A0A7D4PTP8_9SPHI|nr:hypothetical protein [Mucilaginibacter mali]QKJ30208.1 hypothetical protein HQ865_10680 [Mucilaginibacter mali]
MKLKPCIAALVFMFFSIKSFGQYKYIQKLGNLATIALPDTPKVIEKSGNKMYGTKYHGVIFFAAVGDVSGGLRDLFVKNNLDSLYNSYIHAMIAPALGEIFYKNKININGHAGIEFGYKAEINRQMIFRYNHVVAVQDTVLLCSILSADSLSKDDKNLVHFFNGFKVKSAERLSSEHAEELGYNTGYVLGILIVIAIPVLLTLGIVFAIRRIAYRKRNKA